MNPASLVPHGVRATANAAVVQGAGATTPSHRASRGCMCVKTYCARPYKSPACSLQPECIHLGPGPVASVAGGDKYAATNSTAFFLLVQRFIYWSIQLSLADS